MILASQNLYGILASDGQRITDTIKHDVLANGIAYNGHVYLGNWSSILETDANGKILNTISDNGYDNIHTINFYNGQMLVSSTGNDRIYLDKEIIFEPRTFGYRKFIYLNSAVHWQDATILISARLPRQVIFFDVDKRKIERILTLPYLSNQHHPTPYLDKFLVSDGDGIVMFDIDGRPLKKSPAMSWPRGIKVVSRTEVWCVDRNSIMQWNPVTNRINRRIESPIRISGSEGNGGALFDLVIIN
jgi:hypothetical protein